MTTVTKNISDSAGLSGTSTAFPTPLRGDENTGLLESTNVFPSPLNAFEVAGMTDEFVAQLAIELFATPIDGGGLVALELKVAEFYGVSKFTIERVDTSKGTVRAIRGGEFQNLDVIDLVIYDAECPLSTPDDIGPSIYYIATGYVVDPDSGTIDEDLTVQFTTDSFNLHDTAKAVWLKTPGVLTGIQSANNKFLMDHMDDFTYRTRVLASTNVLGRRCPIIVTDVLSGREGTMHIASYPEAETLYGYAWQRPDIMALLAYGETLMFQTTGDVGIDDFYFKVTGDVLEAQLNDGGPVYPDRIWSIPFTEVDAPLTDITSVGSNVTWLDVATNWASWNAVKDNHDDWADVLATA